MHCFKNKFFIIALTVVLCLTVFSSVMAATGNAWFLKDAFGIIATPIRFVFNKSCDAVSGFVDYFTEFDRLREENQKLREENAKLLQDSSESDVLKEENQWLRDYLGIKNQNMSFSLCDATVNGRGSSTSNKTLTLNKGSLHGIKAGMVVITDEGIVGCVRQVGLTFCEVVCLTDASSSVGACVKRSALVGIADGAYGNKCRFSYTTGITSFEDIVEGDLIVSSGSGSIYPYGLPIGTVKEVKIDEASRSVIATIETAVDFDSVKQVMIITDFSVSEE